MSEMSDVKVHFMTELCLWRHFLKSPNFDGWFRNRRREMTQKLEALHLEALCEEVERGGGRKELEPVLHSFLLKSTHFYSSFVCRTCCRESRNTLRWRQLIWFWSSKINWLVLIQKLHFILCIQPGIFGKLVHFPFWWRPICKARAFVAWTAHLRSGWSDKEKCANLPSHWKTVEATLLLVFTLLFCVVWEIWRFNSISNKEQTGHILCFICWTK